MEKKLKKPFPLCEGLQKKWRKMKLTLAFTFLVLVTFGSSYSQVTNLSLSFRNAGIREVLQTIEDQTNYIFLYKDEIFDFSKKYSINFENKNFEEILEVLCQQANVDYEIRNRQIILKEKANYGNREIARENITISGKVTDPSGAPLPGVTVAVKGTTQGIITDTDGNYTLIKVPSDATLVFSFVGMKTQEIVIGGKSTINVVMQEETIGIEEVVAVGYGTQKARKVTGALSKIKNDVFEGRPVTDASQALSGVSTGIQVIQNSGQPGDDNTQIRIRGVSTLTSGGQGPLVLVDGIAGSMSKLNPNDIESVTVLKDAASASIYGSRAAGGVILVTTKKGEAGKPVFRYNGYYGLQSPTRLIDLVSDMATHMELINEAKENMGMADQFDQSEIDAYRQNNDPLLYPNTDWYDYLYGTPTPIQNHNFTASGGNESVLYNLSFGYLGQEGLIGVTHLDRYNFRANNEINLTKRLKVNSILSGSWETITGPASPINAILDWATSPGVVPESDGQYGGSQVPGDGDAGSPLAVWDAQDRTRNAQSFLGKLSAEYRICDGLIFQTNGGITFNNSKVKTLVEPYEVWDFRENNVARYSQETVISLSESFNQNLLLTSYSTFNFEKTFQDKHYLNILLGQSVEAYKTASSSASVKDLYSTVTPVLNAGISEQTVSGSTAAWRLLSLFGRLNYDYKNKYLFEANFRNDASSRFKEGNRWAFFPSFSLGWRISDEKFFPKLKSVSDFKLRGSWGNLGNQNIGNYPYQAVYNIQQNYNFGGALVDGVAQTSLANDDIKWETTTTTDIAMDLSLFKNRFSASFDWFTKMTKDILVQLPIPLTMGNKSAPYQNVGEVKNWGWELDMSYREVINDFRFNVGFNISQVKNEVVKFKGKTPSISGQFIIQEGLPYQSIYGWKMLGIFQSEEEIAESAEQDATYTSPGDIKYEDFYEDGKIDSNDRQVIGNTIPKYNYGLSFDASYKNFDISLLFQGVLDIDRYLSGVNVYPVATNDRGLIPESWLNRWISENPSTTMPRITINGDYSWNYRNSTFWMQDGSYLRLKNVQLGYNIPGAVCKKIGIQNAKVYLNGKNLLTFTNYKGYDPETISTGVTAGYPNTKIISVGLQLNF